MFIIVFIFIIFILILLTCWYKGIDIYELFNKAPPAPHDSPEEKKWKREEYCRFILETIYNKPFKKVRPNWLKNPKTGHNLELDCYNEELKIALEYNGEQHYNENAAYSKGKEWFQEQQFRDQYKYKICKERGIKLIVVPYYVDDIYEFIIKELTQD
jgi:hypothetical protein